METEKRLEIYKKINELIQRTDEKSFESIKSMFQDLLSPRMISKIQAETSFENQKKTFYEMIPKRGPNAFPRLVAALDSVGLYDILEESERGSSTNLEVINNNYAQVRYINDSKPKGNILVINIKKFYSPFKERKGSENDVEKLVKNWQQLGYKVDLKQDLSKKEIEEEVQNFVQSKIHLEADSVWLFIMTHGHSENTLINDSLPSPTYLQASDGNWINVFWIIEQFNSFNAKNLINKPKVIVFQSCRGNIPNIGVAADVSEFRSPILERPLRQIVPNTSDLLVVFSTLPGHSSSRCNENGAYFIQEFCRTIIETTNIHILDVLNKVTRKLKSKEYYDQVGGFEVVNFTSLGFDKLLYL